MNRIRLWFGLTVLIFLPGIVNAQSWKTLPDTAPSEAVTKKISEGEFAGFNSEKGPAPLYLPKHPLARYARQSLAQKKPEMFLETMVLIPRPAGGNPPLLKLFNELGAVSTQEGLEYISYNRGNKPYPLITKSWYVKSFADKGKKIPDPVAASVPNEEQRTVYQKDTTFGANYYTYTYRSEQGALLLTITNLTSLSALGLVPVAKPGEVEIHFIIIPVDEGIFCYTIAFIAHPPKQEKILGYDVNVIGSFEKRIKVILDWYKKRLGIR